MLWKQGILRAASDVGDFGKKSLEDEFEPFIILEKYMTPKDDAIRETNLPERIQLYEDITRSPPTDDKTIDEESAWIHEQLLDGGAIPPQIVEMQVITENQIDKTLGVS